MMGDELSNSDILRYGRQMILPQIGRPGQEALKRSSVLLVGMGGLGCPCSLYLASAGVGTLGLLDSDTVDISNLHRQVLHTEANVSKNKVDSAEEGLMALNSNITYVKHNTALTAANAEGIVTQYDIVVDCTDNAATRYLVNDVCVFLNKPLVSGSALRTEGQLSTYHYQGGPCYRCIHPQPPPPDTVGKCGEVGVLGPITGIVGSVQALEVIKILTNSESAYSGKMLLVSPWDGIMKCVRLRPRQKNCAVCGDTPSITAPVDYVQFCGLGSDSERVCERSVGGVRRISCKELSNLSSPLLLDVRPVTEYDICHLPHSTNVPYTKLDKAGEVLRRLTGKERVYVICRRGNDSQLAVQQLQAQYTETQFVDVIGGLVAWSNSVDHSFPVY